jgi:hypothetical protein
LAAGYRNPNVSRVAQAEARIREGRVAPERVALNVRSTCLNMGTYCDAFMRSYLFKNSQFSPSKPIMYVDFCGLKELFRKYLKDCKGWRTVKFSYFDILWKKRLASGITDPETGVTYQLAIRQNRTAGFAHIT